MTKKLPIGHGLFENVIDDGIFYIDKSLLVREFWEEDSLVVLIPRPRRFGKTLNLSMIWSFFDCALAAKRDTAGLFDDLNIAQHPDIMAHQGQHPVIHLSFRNIEDSEGVSTACGCEGCRG